MTEQNYGDMNVEDLQKLARERNIEGRSSMDKDALVAALESTDASGGGDPETAHVASGGDLNNPPERHDEAAAAEAAKAVSSPDAPAGDDMRPEDRELAEEDEESDPDTRMEVGDKGERRVAGTEQFTQPPHSTPDSESLQEGGVEPLTEGDEVVGGPNA